MKKLLLVRLSFLLLIVGCDNNPSSSNELVDIKTEALNFSLQVIESIIKQDVITFKTFYLDSLWDMHQDEQFAISEEMIEEMFTSLLYHSTIASTATMNDYYSNYTSTIYSYDEFSEYAIAKWNYELPQFDWITSNDYFYAGVPIDNGIAIIWDDFNHFLISRINNKWWIKAVLD